MAAPLHPHTALPVVATLCFGVGLLVGNEVPGLRDDDAGHVVRPGADGGGHVGDRAVGAGDSQDWDGQPPWSGSESVMVASYGNVLSACGFLYGVATHELEEAELEYEDSDFDVVIAVRATKVQLASERSRE